MVAVAVGQDEATDVGQRTPDLCELALQIVPVTGQARVDQRDAFREVDEIGGDDVVADPVQVRGELHGGSSPRDCDGYVT
nr:hypothetical protein [Microbacterium barkeri]